MSALSELLADRDRLAAEVKRLRYSLDTAVSHRDQAVRTCERRTAERGVARARVDVLERRELETSRLREALQHIADGNISPSIDFAKHVLDGETVAEAHKKGVTW